MDENVQGSAAAETQAAMEEAFGASNNSSAGAGEKISADAEGMAQAETQAGQDKTGQTEAGGNKAKTSGNGADNSAEKEGAKGAGKGAGEGFSAESWTKYVDGLGDEVGVDKEALKEFGGLAGKLGMKEDAAQKIFEWAKESAFQQQKALTAKGREDLQKEWGANYDANTEKATSIVALLDRQLGDGRFKAAIEATGACRNPDFVRGLYHISELLAEDSIGVNASGGAAMKEESALEGLKNFFK